jgi:hypothetical protein
MRLDANEFLTLPELPRALGVSITYHRLYLAAVAGRIPAERTANGRWRVNKADLPLIRDRLGLAEASGS